MRGEIEDLELEKQQLLVPSQELSELADKNLYLERQVSKEQQSNQVFRQMLQKVVSGGFEGDSIRQLVDSCTKTSLELNGVKSEIQNLKDQMMHETELSEDESAS